MFFFCTVLAGTMETQHFEAEMIISAYYRRIMHPYLNVSSSHLHHIVVQFTAVLQVHLDLQWLKELSWLLHDRVKAFQRATFLSLM